MKIYVSGPMTGQPNNNKELFDAATAHLRSLGHEVVSPAEQPGEILEGNGWDASDAEYENYLSRDMDFVDWCEAIVFIKGWSFSGGAGREGRRGIDGGKKLYILWRDETTVPEEREGGWFPLLRIDNKYFLENSRVERLQPHERSTVTSS
jgi:hypothetical protein